jgi:hypothetical protein
VQPASSPASPAASCALQGTHTHTRIHTYRSAHTEWQRGHTYVSSSSSSVDDRVGWTEAADRLRAVGARAAVY